MYTQVFGITFKTLLFLVFYSCTWNKPQSEYEKSGRIEIVDASKEQSGYMYLNRNHWTMEVKIVENTLNDTANYGPFQIWPGRVGKLDRAECFSDSLKYFYKPYKATKGKLVLEYRSFK